MRALHLFYSRPNFRRAALPNTAEQVLKCRIALRFCFNALDKLRAMLVDKIFKRSSGKKGRELFHPLRLALTGRHSGPEMGGLLARMGKERAIRRLEAAARR